MRMDKKIKPQLIEDRVLSLEYEQEKTERHYYELKEKVDIVMDDVTAIKNAVIGNDMNGNNGMVQEIKLQKTKIYNLEVKCIKYELYFKQLAVAITMLTGALLTALIKLFI
jgi:hypothetical protein